MFAWDVEKWPNKDIFLHSCFSDIIHIKAENLLEVILDQEEHAGKDIPPSSVTGRTQEVKQVKVAATRSNNDINNSQGKLSETSVQPKASDSSAAEAGIYSIPDKEWFCTIYILLFSITFKWIHQRKTQLPFISSLTSYLYNAIDTSVYTKRQSYKTLQNSLKRY